MKNIGVSTPAWSFVGEKNILVKQHNVPGPGAHQISTGERATWDAAPKWAFGTSARPDICGGNKVPGPDVPNQYFSDGEMKKAGEDDKQN